MLPRETRPGVPDGRATGQRNNRWRHRVIRHGARARAFGGCDPRRRRCGFGGDSTVADGKDESSGLAPDNNSHRASESEVGHALCGCGRGSGPSRIQPCGGGRTAGCGRGRFDETDSGGGSRGRPGMAAMAGGAPAGVRVLTRQGAGSRRFGLLPSVPGSIDVSWTAVDRVSGQLADGYEIQVSEDGTHWRSLVDDTASTALTYTHNRGVLTPYAGMTLADGASRTGGRAGSSVRMPCSGSRRHNREAAPAKPPTRWGSGQRADSERRDESTRGAGFPT